MEKEIEQGSNKTIILTNLFENFLQMNLLEVDDKIRNKIMKRWDQFKGVFIEEHSSMQEKELLKKQSSNEMLFGEQSYEQMSKSKSSSKRKTYNSNKVIAQKQLNLTYYQKNPLLGFTPNNFNVSPFRCKRQFGTTVNAVQNNTFQQPKKQQQKKIVVANYCFDSSSKFTENSYCTDKASSEVNSVQRQQNKAKLIKKEVSGVDVKNDEMEIIKVNILQQNQHNQKHFNRKKLIDGAKSLMSYMKQNEHLIYPREKFQKENLGQR